MRTGILQRAKPPPAPVAGWVARGATARPELSLLFRLASPPVGALQLGMPEHYAFLAFYWECRARRRCNARGPGSMNWIRLSSEYPRHRKTLRLVRRLGPAAELYPIRLWLWAVEQSPDGSLRDIDAGELASIVGHAGDEQELLAVMLTFGFLEEAADGLRIRSWYEHQGILIDRQRRNTERKRVLRNSEGQGSDVPAPSDATNETNERDETNETDETNEEALRAAIAAEPSIFPANLDVPAFRQAWAEWFAYRRERNLASWKPRTIAAKLEQLADWGPTRAVEAIRTSIREGWQGIFEPKATVPAARPAIPVASKPPPAGSFRVR